jgi:hypothetical protein
MTPLPRPGYRTLVLGATIVPGLVAQLSRVLPDWMGLLLYLPIALPIRLSLWLAVYLPLPQTFPIWLGLFAVVSLCLNAILFLPVKYRSSFADSGSFLLAQCGLLVVYVLLTIPAVLYFMESMSV